MVSNAPTTHPSFRSRRFSAAGGWPTSRPNHWAPVDSWSPAGRWISQWNAPSVSVPTVWNSLKPDCILLTLLAHLNLSFRAHCSLLLAAAWNSTVQSHRAFVIRSLFVTWALCKLCIVLYCNEADQVYKWWTSKIKQEKWSHSV